MNPNSRKTVLAASLLLAMTVIGGEALAEPVAPAQPVQDVTEARQETQIWTTFALSPSLRANDLKVAVHKGKATLTGKVDEDVGKELAKQIALGVSGISDVDNQIVVDPAFLPPHPADRSYGEIVDDATITTAVKSKLLWSKNANGMATTVLTRSGKVTLTGTADSKAARELAGKLAMNTHGVVAVDNQLALVAAKPGMAATAKSSAKEAGQDISDSWITTKVKSTFMYSTHVDGSAIKVDTVKGVVTLSGTVTSSAERAQAIELARNLRGVKDVEAKGLKF